MPSRVTKFAKQEGRTVEEVLAEAKRLGLPYTTPKAQLSRVAEQKLRKALADRPQAASPQAQIRVTAKREAPQVVLNDPLADTWMDLALSDDLGFRRAQVEREADRKLNKKTSHQISRSEHPLRPDDDRDDAPFHDFSGRPEGRPTPADAAPLNGRTILSSLGLSKTDYRKHIQKHLSPGVRKLWSHARLDRKQAKSFEIAVKDSVGRVCENSACQAHLKTIGRPFLVIGDPTHCEVCAGSNTQRAYAILTQELKASAVERLLLVGGSPKGRDEVKAHLTPAGIALKWVDGTEKGRANKSQAQADLRWADLAIIWGSTQLDHRVSDLYKAGKSRHNRRPLTVLSRSPERLADDLLRLLSEGADR